MSPFFEYIDTLPLPTQYGLLLYLKNNPAVLEGNSENIEIWRWKTPTPAQQEHLDEQCIQYMSGSLNAEKLLEIYFKGGATLFDTAQMVDLIMHLDVSFFADPINVSA